MESRGLQCQCCGPGALTFGKTVPHPPIVHCTGMTRMPNRRQEANHPSPKGASYESPSCRGPDLPPSCRNSPPLLPPPTRNPGSHDFLPVVPLRVFASSRETVGSPTDEDGRKNHKNSQRSAFPLEAHLTLATKCRRPPHPEARVRSPSSDGTEDGSCLDHGFHEFHGWTRREWRFPSLQAGHLADWRQSNPSPSLSVPSVPSVPSVVPTAFSRLKPRLDDRNRDPSARPSATAHPPSNVNSMGLTPLPPSRL